MSALIQPVDILVNFYTLTLKDTPEILVVNWVMTGGPKPLTVEALIVKE